MAPPVDWKTDQKYNKLIKFLIHRTKYSKTPLSIKGLARECTEKSWCSQELKCLCGRIYKFRSEIHQLDSIDTATKVRLLFGLSAPIDEDFLNELRMDAHVKVDENNRITKYRAKDRRLELEGEHSLSTKSKEGRKQKKRGKPEDSDDEYQVSTHKTPGSMKRAAPEVPNSSKRTRNYSSDDSENIPESRGREQSHHPKKQRKMGNEKSQESAEESENYAPDDSTKIRSRKPEPPNPGSQSLRQSKLEGAPGASRALPHKETSNLKYRGGPRALECSMNNFDDVSQDSMLKTPGSEAAAEVPNTSNRSNDSSSADSMSSEDHAPNDSDRIPESRPRKLVCRFSPNAPSSRVQQLLQPKKQIKMGSEKSQKDSDDGSQESVPKTPGSVKRSTPEVSNSSKTAKDSSPAGSMNSEDHAPNDSARTPESGAEEPSSPKTPNPGIQSPRQPFPETPRARTRQEAPVFKGAPRTPGDEIPPEKPIKAEPGVDEAYTPRIKLLEAIQSLVLSLDMPSLSPLLNRIEKKLRELSSNEKIPNDEMAAALELFVVKITNDSVSNLPETVESVSLSHFLCYLKSLILNSKLEGLENLLEKIKGRIRDPSTKDKMIPVEKVMSTLQPILDVIGF